MLINYLPDASIEVFPRQRTVFEGTIIRVSCTASSAVPNPTRDTSFVSLRIVLAVNGGRIRSRQARSGFRTDFELHPVQLRPNGILVQCRVFDLASELVTIRVLSGPDVTRK